MSSARQRQLLTTRNGRTLADGGPVQVGAWQVYEFRFNTNLEELTMKLYCGIDLHSNNHYLTIIDEHDQRLIEKRLPNDLTVTLKTLEPYRADLTGIAIERRSIGTGWLTG